MLIPYVFSKKKNLCKRKRKKTTKTSLWPCEGDLEGLVSGNEGGQLGEGLFPGAAHSHQQGVTPGGADDAGHLHQMYHGILEEDQVHAWPSDALVVLLEEHL